jgi:hypothetical protein
MKKLTTVVLTPNDLTEALSGAVATSCKVNVPRKENEDGNVAAPFVTSTIGPDEFADALAGFMDVDVAELAGMAMTVKKDGGLELTY